MTRGLSDWLAYSYAGEFFLVGLVAAWALFCRRFLDAPDSRREQPRGGYAVVLVSSAIAIVLRHFAYRIYPPASDVGTEELLCGAISCGVKLAHALAVKWRVSSAIGALGFMWGGFTLEAFRFPYRLMGDVAILFTGLTLHRLRVPSPLLFFFVVTMGLAKWMIATSGFGWINYSGVAMVPPLLFLLAWMADTRSPAAASLAGAMSGVLYLEYLPFKVIVALSFGWLAFVAIGPGRPRESSRWKLPAAFLVGFLISLTPLLLHIHSIGLEAYLRQDLLESFLRYGGERHSWYSPNFAPILRASSWAFFGGVGGGSELLETWQSPLVYPILGKLFLGCLLFALMTPRRQPFAFALGLTILASAVSSALTTNFYREDRLAGCFPLLLVLSALVLRQGLEAASRFRAWPRLAPWALFAVLSASLAVGQWRDLNVLAADEHVKLVFDNSDYSPCRHIVDRASEGQAVILVAPVDGACGNFYDGSWLLREKAISLKSMRELPTPDAIPNGVLVVMDASDMHGLVPEKLAAFRELAERAASAGSFATYLNSAGKIRTASFCRGCEPTAPRP